MVPNNHLALRGKTVRVRSLKDLVTTRTAVDFAIDLPRASIHHPRERRWERGKVIALEYAGRDCSFYRIRVGRELVRVDARSVRRAAVEVRP